MAELAQKPMTLAEFLDWDDGTDARYELVFGRPTAMAPASEAHGTILGNLSRVIGNALQVPCRVVVEAGIILPDRADTYFQADLAVTCLPPEPGGRYLREPLLVVEVLSPSTATHDRGFKLHCYRQVPSIREILMIATEERRADLWRRRDGDWLLQDLIGEASFRLASVGCDLSLNDVYRAVPI